MKIKLGQKQYYRRLKIQFKQDGSSKLKKTVIIFQYVLKQDLLLKAMNNKKA
jgi:hypothetical protein